MARESRLVTIDDPILTWFNSANPIDDLLPIELDNGAKILGIRFLCHTCKTNSESENGRGELFTHSIFEYRMHSVSFCKTCNVYTPLVTIMGPVGNVYFMENVTDEYPDQFIRNCVTVKPVAKIGFFNRFMDW